MSLDQLAKKLIKGMTPNQAERFKIMIETSVNMGAKNTSNMAHKTIAEFQLHELADKCRRWYQ